MGFSQEIKDSLVLTEDNSTPLVIRSFKEDLSNKYNDKKFNYELADGESQNLVLRTITWLSDGLHGLFGIEIPADIAKVLEVVIYLLMGLLAIYLLIKFLTGQKVSHIFNKKASSLDPLNLSEEHIDQIDLEALLANAINQKNYRSAIRYQYLIALKTLSSNDVIAWEYKKTNQDYEQEITSPSLKILFKEISYLYEYVWYGEQEIDEAAYRAAQPKFDLINNPSSHG